MAKRNVAQYKIADPLERVVDAAPSLTMHPGVWIRRAILPAWDLQISGLARLLQVNRANLSEVLAGKRDVSRELAYRLGALLNDHVADLVIAYQQAWDLQQETGRRAELRELIQRLPEPDSAPA